MSWTIFQTNMNRYMNAPTRILSSDDFARKFAIEYIKTIHSGNDSISLASVKSDTDVVMKSKVESMIRLFSAALHLGKSSPDKFDLIQQLGMGIMSYWTGAVLNEFPIPIIPAPGSTNNIMVVSNIVVNAGNWKSVAVSVPINSTDVFIQNFITTAQLHLQTISGTIITTSIYPPLGAPAPGIIPWQGYIVPV